MLLCPTLCDPMGCSPPGSSIHGIFQASILECIAISFSRGSSWPRDWTCISCQSRFTPWSGKFTHARELLSLYPPTTEPTHKGGLSWREAAETVAAEGELSPHACRLPGGHASTVTVTTAEAAAATVFPKIYFLRNSFDTGLTRNFFLREFCQNYSSVHPLTFLLIHSVKLDL